VFWHQVGTITEILLMFVFFSPEKMGFSTLIISSSLAPMLSFPRVQDEDRRFLFNRERPALGDAITDSTGHREAR